ncbi:hypothetical protein H6G54_02505 [Anabaena cylindrica FACHB-243]|uniref:DUF5331 domain-containing protein n=1 Tax=Anabaena cylindrica (strain ATCC 27899 / PCC 7122) TaxID=272123 RepID=K9ZLQ5_ANACC|nr:MULTISPECIES: DUF5331 domain-containing protein [Anabaena]AFZ59245.1 hypothetical protein Anacy_3870 [Anabaena cylindrica PCC 7122]MBD2416600.1 hypothetical protein [Anabaena cylindrica FACHB-243]MBY5280901.1 DUF5331 domain-containing protein [Anabaena sp. CCAP 1446/1C]MBY5310532.1 DUF5331 domain-containing protein [Anabaena sp. CCAP 1446/1C]MCM2407538.1 DUF5331 domain-containing protein [Anabaena sp. CCAP 1446/1C]
MDIQQLRQSLKMKWLNYCEENRAWLVKMRVWHSYDGVRRPSSGYMLATLSVLEPELKEILPFILDLNNDPDQIVTALGLHFNPDEELGLLKSEDSVAKNEIVSKPGVKMQVADTPRPKEHKQVLLKITTGVEEKGQPVSVGAVATAIDHHSPPKMPFGMRREQTVKPTDKSAVRSHSPIQSSLTITTAIPTQTKAVPSLPNMTEPNHNAKFMNTPVKQVSSISPTQTNARSLPSWIDESCQGVKWQQDETIKRKL